MFGDKDLEEDITKLEVADTNKVSHNSGFTEGNGEVKIDSILTDCTDKKKAAKLGDNTVTEHTDKIADFHLDYNKTKAVLPSEERGDKDLNDLEGHLLLFYFSS